VKTFTFIQVAAGNPAWRAFGKAIGIGNARDLDMMDALDHAFLEVP